jgi:uncharacterized damage-inducible protein DinB
VHRQLLRSHPETRHYGIVRRVRQPAGLRVGGHGSFFELVLPSRALIRRKPTRSVNMRKVASLSLLSGLLAAMILVAPGTVRAQEKDKGAPKPALSPSGAVLDAWNDIGRRLIDMAEDFPEDKYGYKATPQQRTFAEVLLHVAASNYYFTNPVTGKNEKIDENPTQATYKTKADVVAYLKKSFGDGAAAIKAKGDKGMNDEVVEPFSNQYQRISDFAYGLAMHSSEHYGLLVAYYRLNGMVPPESRPKKK